MQHYVLHVCLDRISVIDASGQRSMYYDCKLNQASQIIDGPLITEAQTRTRSCSFAHFVMQKRIAIKIKTKSIVQLQIGNLFSIYPVNHGPIEMYTYFLGRIWIPIVISEIVQTKLYFCRAFLSWILRVRARSMWQNGVINGQGGFRCVSHFIYWLSCPEVRKGNYSVALL